MLRCFLEFIGTNMILGGYRVVGKYCCWQEFNFGFLCVLRYIHQFGPFAAFLFLLTQVSSIRFWLQITALTLFSFSMCACSPNPVSPQRCEFLTAIPCPLIDVSVAYEEWSRSDAVLVPAVLRDCWCHLGPSEAEGEMLPNSSVWVHVMPGVLCPSFPL